MIYIKSTFAGLIAVVGAYFLLAAIGVLVLVITSAMRNDQDSVIGFDVIALGRSLLAIATGVLAFIAGFFWEYLRISKAA